GKLLFEQIRQGIVEAILLKIRAGNPCGVILRPQIIDFFQFCAVLSAADRSRVTYLGCSSRTPTIRCQCCGAERHPRGEDQDAKGHYSFQEHYLLTLPWWGRFPLDPRGPGTSEPPEPVPAHRPPGPSDQTAA